MNPGVIVDPPPLDAGIRHAGPGQGPKAVDAVQLSRRQRRLRPGAAALRRHRQVPAVQRRRDVPELPGHARGEALHARAGPTCCGRCCSGELVTDGWRSTEVRDALDLCLSCKGCLSDCPVNVDMATYKAEFTHHHYARRPWARPLSHWSMGWLPQLSRIASTAPRLVNRHGGHAGWRSASAGSRPSATSPRFAERDVHVVVRAARGAGPAGDPAARSCCGRTPSPITLPPQVGRAAVAVLEAAGYEVMLPDGPVCCGLTWISTGQLRRRQAAHQAHRWTCWRPHLESGIPIVGLEPSCTAVLRSDAASFCTTTPRRRAGGVDRHLRRVAHPSRTGNRRTSPRMRWCRPTATSTPCSASTPTAR